MLQNVKADEVYSGINNLILADFNNYTITKENSALKFEQLKMEYKLIQNSQDYAISNPEYLGFAKEEIENIRIKMESAKSEMETIKNSYILNIEQKLSDLENEYIQSTNQINEINVTLFRIQDLDNYQSSIQQELKTKFLV